MNVAGPVGIAPAGGRLVVRCLGRFRVESASGAALTIRTRKARALLAAVALSRRPMSREALADLLWSDRGPAQARGSLRQAIFELQRDSRHGSFLVVGRDDVAIRSDWLVTDIELLRNAAGLGDWAGLLRLLEQTEAGLLTDLDGLDSEFDSWLRSERAHEPGRLIATVLAAANLCLERADAQLALSIIDEVLRLDPSNEEAARIAMRIDHQLGDSSALRRHFSNLRDRLREDYDAEPLAETRDLFLRLSSGAEIAGPAPAEAAASRPRAPAPAATRRRLGAVLAGLLALFASVAAFMHFLSRPQGSSDEGPVVLAVLPFDQQGVGDTYLADGLWDDTRGALSRTGALHVLGRATMTAASRQKLSPAQYRRRFGVSYLLAGAIRQSGNQVRVSVSLTRTSDGVAVWEGSYRARVGDPFALQEAIAGDIEGKLRGRLAPGGGRRADQIATSPETYALYSEARSLLRMRDLRSARRAQALLRRALALDPNYAPAWAALASAIYFAQASPAGAADQHQQALAAVRHALALAPNLAEAHGLLGLVEGDVSPQSERPLRRAVALDPSYAEAWNWLGNSFSAQARATDAISAYNHAIDLDPLWFPPAHNLVSIAHEAGDRTSFSALIGKLSRAGAGRPAMLSLTAEDRILSGDYSDAVKRLAAIDRDATGGAPASAIADWVDVLTRLGYPEAASRKTGVPDWYGPVVRGDRLPPTTMDGKPVTAADFWEPMLFPAFAARAMVNRGRGDELVRLYRAAFRSPDEFISSVSQGDKLTYLAPTLASALRAGGSSADADYILTAAAAQAEARYRALPQGAESAAGLAYVRAAAGQREEGLRLLALAIRRGWLPDGSRQSLDVAQEPAFASLRSDARLQSLRKRVLAHIASERAELGPLKI